MGYENKRSSSLEQSSIKWGGRGELKGFHNVDAPRVRRSKLLDNRGLAVALSNDHLSLEVVLSVGRKV